MCCPGIKRYLTRYKGEAHPTTSFAIQFSAKEVDARTNAKVTIGTATEVIDNHIAGESAFVDEAEIVSTLLTGHLLNLSEKLNVMSAITDKIGSLAEVRGS